MPKARKNHDFFWFCSWGRAGFMDIRPRTDVKVRLASTKNFFKMWEYNRDYRSVVPVTAYYDENNRRLWAYDKSAKDSKGFGEGYFIKNKDYTEAFIDAYNSFMAERMIYGKIHL